MSDTLCRNMREVVDDSDYILQYVKYNMGITAHITYGINERLVGATYPIHCFVK